MGMTGFICHDDYLNKTSKLTDEEVGRLFRACMVFHATGVITELDGRESIAFDFIREDIEKAEKAYQEKCETNRRNRLTKATVDNERQHPSTTVNDRQQPSAIKEKDNKENKKKENEQFARFWAAYPRHEAKAVALKAFEKVKPSEELLQKMLNAIEMQKKTAQWAENGGQFVPHPATWLNQHRWEDEVKEYAQQKRDALPAQDYHQRDYSSAQDEAFKRMMAMEEAL